MLTIADKAKEKTSIPKTGLLGHNPPGSHCCGGGLVTCPDCCCDLKNCSCFVVSDSATGKNQVIKLDIETTAVVEPEDDEVDDPAEGDDVPAVEEPPRPVCHPLLDSSEGRSPDSWPGVS